jgi:protein-L-isoaspartate(D-aspartate) O-methyltransferase
MAKAEAWANRPQAIGHRQTISQPFIVALMTDLLDVGPGDRVLEIGTGSGYQAAVLAEMGAKVFSIEVIPALAASARLALDAEGYGSVVTRIGDGALGWPEEAPFDAIIVTAAAPSIPTALTDQLRPGGRMAIPIGLPGSAQTLILVEKHPDGTTESRDVLPVLFVPLTDGP